MEAEQYLNRLVGEILVSTDISTNTIYPINDSAKESATNALFTLSNVLHFREYDLHINNPITITPYGKELSNLIGQKVIYTVEKPKEASIVFEGGDKIWVNMSDEVYFDPEAMVLNGPNGFWVVWN